jgi:hypothetical protein
MALALALVLLLPAAAALPDVPVPVKAYRGSVSLAWEGGAPEPWSIASCPGAPTATTPVEAQTVIETNYDNEGTPTMGIAMWGVGLLLQQPCATVHFCRMQGHLASGALASCDNGVLEGRLTLWQDWDFSWYFAAELTSAAGSVERFSGVLHDVA